MAGLLSGMGNKLSGLLGDPALQNAFWLTVASGSDQNRAAQLKEERRLSDQEARLEEYRQLQMAEARRQAEEAQKRQAQEIIARTTLQHFSENPNAIAFGGPQGNPQTQLAGLLSRGVDPTAAGGLISAGAGPKLTREQQIYEAAQRDPEGFGRWYQSQQAAQSGGQGQYFAGVTVQMPDGSFAQVQPGNRPGMGVNTVPLPGAPLTYDPSVAAAIAAARASGTKQGEKEGTRIANNPETQMTIAEIEAASADGGLIDKSTGSGIGTAVDSTAGLFGVATDGAQAIAQLKPIADRALKMVPRFEGPQSDKDTQSYREAAGQLADPTVPREVRKAAAREIVRLMKARQGQFIDTSAIQPGSPVPGTSAAQQPAAPDRQTVVDFNTL